MNYFFDPEGDPKPEGFLGMMLAAAAVWWTVDTITNKPMDEIVYMDFLNNYLVTG